MDCVWKINIYIVMPSLGTPVIALFLIYPKYLFGYKI